PPRGEGRQSTSRLHFLRHSLRKLRLWNRGRCRRSRSRCRFVFRGGGHPLPVAVRAQAPLASRFAGLLGGERIGGALLVGCLAALASRLARRGRGELVGGPLGVGGLASLAGDLALLLGVHSGKTTVALFWHNRLPYRVMNQEVVLHRADAAA